MALTAIQRDVCRLIAENRREGGESYVAGGTALNTILGAPRLSRDVDLFHDTEEALARTWDADRALLTGAGYALEVIRERPSFVDAIARRGHGAVVLQWVRDSAYRFFPLVSHPELGLTLHPFDLATKKVLALVGRLEVRDWVDIIGCHEGIQPFGYLAWAACGKDPGYSPESIRTAAARSSHYSRMEVEQLAFDGPPPDAGELSRRWHAALDAAAEITDALPIGQVGRCVVSSEGSLYRGDAAALGADLAAGRVCFHQGSIRGAYPVIGG